jgi:hypothetical protein
MLRNSIFGGRLIQKDLRRRVVFQVAVQKVQSVERDQAITRVGVLTPYFRKGACYVIDALQLCRKGQYSRERGDTLTKLHFSLLFSSAHQALKERPPDQAVLRLYSELFDQLSFPFGCNCNLDTITFFELHFVAVFVGQ